MLSTPGEAFRPAAQVPHTPLDVSRFLLWLSALLLPLDVAVRRLALRREDVALFVGALAAALAWARRRRRGGPRRRRRWRLSSPTSARAAGRSRHRAANLRRPENQRQARPP